MDEITNILREYTNIPANSESKSDIRSIVQCLNNNDLLRVWRRVWKSTPKKFCEEFKINEGNFSSFCLGSKKSPVSRHAIECFLLGEKFSRFTNDPTHPHPLLKQEKELFWDLVLRSKHGLRGIVFIDGDNAMGDFRFIEWLLKNNLYFPVHVIVNIVKGGSSSRIFWVPDVPWCSIVEAHTNVKDAVDHAITFQIATLHNLISDPKILFFIISNDLFALELQEHIENREVHVINSVTTNSALAIFNSLPDVNFRPEIDTIRCMMKEISDRYFSQSEIQAKVSTDLQNFPNLPSWLNSHAIFVELERIRGECQKRWHSDPLFLPTVKFQKEETNTEGLKMLQQLLSERHRVPLSVLGNLIPLTEPLKKELGGSSWARILTPDILELLNARLCGSSGQKLLMLRGIPDKLLNEKMDEDTQLRMAYKLNWESTHKDFCERYNINEGNFASWRRGRRICDPGCRRVVLNMLEDKGHKF